MHRDDGFASISGEQLLAFLGDRVLDYQTTELFTMLGPAPLSPGSAGALSFAKGQSVASLNAIRDSKSSVVLVEPSAFAALGAHARCILVAVTDPRLEFARVVTHLFAHRGGVERSPAAVISDMAEIGTDTSIGPGAYIAAGVSIGSNCRIGANSVVLEGTVIGDHTSIGPNSTVGHVGFGYAREDDGSPVLIPHSGGVTIGSHVDVGANSCIDRGTMDDTVIDDHVKIDNLVHIAHNCKIERGAFIIATAVLCGGVQVGPRAWVAPNATVLEQMRIGADATVGLASTVLRDVPEGATVVGSPAKELTR